MTSGFEITPGHMSSPVILHVPHSSTRIPEEVRANIVLSDEELNQELLRITDSFTDQVAATAAEASPITPWIFRNDLSRLVIDPERFTDEREEMLVVGMGAVYTRTSQKQPLRDETIFHPGSPAWTQLIDDYFTPYTRALQQLVNERLEACGEVIIIDVHSFPSQALPYELHAALSRPEICIGTDDFHTPDHLTNKISAAFADFGTVGVNEPFIGTYVPLEQYGSDQRVKSVMIEIRRDLYMGEATGEFKDDAIEALGLSLAHVL